MTQAVAELEAEQHDLEVLLRGLEPHLWAAPTPAAGWNVQDQVSHLADTSEICTDTVTGGPRQLNEEALAAPSPEAFTESGCIKGRSMTPEQVIEWYVETAALSCKALLSKGPKERVPWGLGMSARMMTTARLMEFWAHGCDIREAVGAPLPATPRLRSIATLALRAVPYAFTVTKVTPPPGTLRAELSFGDEVWRIGSDDATDVITGDAFEFCRLGTQRARLADLPSLRAKGPLAELALNNMRAFL